MKIIEANWHTLSENSCRYSHCWGRVKFEQLVCPCISALRIPEDQVVDAGRASTDVCNLNFVASLARNSERVVWLLSTS